LEDDAIARACEEAGHVWRERELGPVATVKMFFLQILFGNAACEFVPHLAGEDRGTVLRLSRVLTLSRRRNGSGVCIAGARIAKEHGKMPVPPNRSTAHGVCLLPKAQRAERK
jgi:hypothetical protein